MPASISYTPTTPIAGFIQTSQEPALKSSKPLIATPAGIQRAHTHTHMYIYGNECISVSVSISGFAVGESSADWRIPVAQLANCAQVECVQNK